MIRASILFPPRFETRTLRPFLLKSALCALAAAATLTGCTPTYDWRTVMNNDDAYEVTLPAKPRSDEREIVIAGKSMKMRMQISEAGNNVFAVGTVELPAADAELQQATLDYLQQGLAHNVGAAVAAHPVSIDIATGGHLPGTEINVNGASGQQGESRTIHARFVANKTHVYQVAIVGDKVPPVDQADQFFSSFKLY